MLDFATAQAQLPHTLRESALTGLGELYRGKVRDNYRTPERMVMVTTDRLSAFDHVLTTVPFKGEVLNRLTTFWFEKTRDIIQNHVIDVPDPSVIVARRCAPFPYEVVVRGYLTGSLWRDYAAGRGAAAYGLELPRGMRKDQRFEAPIVTPSTKAEYGQHDLPVSEKEILAGGKVAPEMWRQATGAALRLFARGQEHARARGLILVDTKYEFGLAGGELVLIDEIHTPDSSRYWIAEGAEERFARGQEQQMLDKENVRQWLIQERGYQGDGPPPAIPDPVRCDLAVKYAALYERLTGDSFEARVGSVAERIAGNLRAKGYL